MPSAIFTRIGKGPIPGGATRFNARKNNAGWRIDYFITTDDIKDKIKDVVFHNDVFGSDHCPIEMDIDL